MSHPSSLLDLLTFATPRLCKSGDQDTYTAFSATLAEILRLSGVTAHPRLRQTQKNLEATTACLYAAYMDLDLKEVCTMTGQSYYGVMAHRRATSLPSTRKELDHTWQALLLASLFEKDMAGMFKGFQSISALIEKATETIGAELDKPGADLKVVSEALSKLSNLAFPFMFLYRDHLDTNLDNKIKRVMRKEWSRNTLKSIQALFRESPTPE